MQTITSIFDQLFGSIIGFLPRSPFRQYIDAIGDIPYLANLNWIIPIPECIAVLQVWLSVVIIYYTYSAIMRFLRLIR